MNAIARPLKTWLLEHGALFRREHARELPPVPAGPSDTRAPVPHRKPGPRRLFEGPIVRRAIVDAFKKLDPRHQIKNPVMFVVEVGTILTALLFLQAIFGTGEAPAGFILAICLWLLFTVVFANFAEAMAEGRGRAQAETLRKARKDTPAKKLVERAMELLEISIRRASESEPMTSPDKASSSAPARPELPFEVVSSAALRKGDLVLIEAEDDVPCDGEIIVGIASVNEAAITGESAPVIREAGGDRSAVVAGTRVLSDWLIVRVGANPGETFLDRMIALVEGAKRQKTPNEIALNILLAALTIVFLLATVTILPFSIFAVRAAGVGQPVTITVLVALLVCLIPTTIGGLLSAIGIAGMDRMIEANVIATSGRAVEAAGDVDVLLLDKTGTITLGNRQACAFHPAPGVTERELADTAQLASLADATPEGRSIVVLAKEKFAIRERSIHDLGAVFVPFTAQTRMSGVDFPAREVRKGSFEAISAYVRKSGGAVPSAVQTTAEAVASKGGTPLVVAEGVAHMRSAAPARVLGVIELKDIIKGGIKERFAELRRIGIKTVMITGDNPLTAAAIAAESGVDDYLAEATPEAKLRLIREQQAGGRLVAMTGDGTNDAPALAQADVAVAMSSGTQAAREAGNMVDLDSNPTKLIEIVTIGKQMLMTRGALTTFSIANDVSKYFAIIPAAFAVTYPQLDRLNVMRLTTPESAIMSAVIFNALVIVFLIPLALRGVAYRPISAGALLRRNLLVYGLGGVVVPFIGIKVIDLILAALHLA